MLRALESMTPGYFHFIHQQVSRFCDTGFMSIEKDVTMLEVFCRLVETWEYSGIIDERLTFSVITCHLKLIWSDDLCPLLEQLDDESPSLESVISDLKGMILQSKQLVERWCLNPILSSSSMIMHYKSSLFQQLPDFVHQIRKNLSYGNSSEINVLERKMEILESALKQVNMGCPDGDGVENLPFMNFAGSYANNVAWFTCLYWAKGDPNNEISFAEILFDMSHKFITYAYDIIPFFAFHITFNSFDVHLESDFFRIGEVVGSLVDFFFDHLVLGDDFVFLRDRLMFLFTFLADPPPCESENVEQGDIIRSDISAILHEDEYLLSNFKEMNKDFCDQKALFSAFMNRIDTVNDKIRQLHRGGSSDSWITLELEKMEFNCFLSAMKLLFVSRDNVEKMQLCRIELRFLRMSFLWLATWDDTDEEIKLKLSSVITSFQEKIRRSMLETKAWRVDLFHLRIRYKTSTSYKILKFMDSILDNLNDLVSYRASKSIPFMKQIETLEGKLVFLKNLLKLAVNCKHCQELGEFKIFVQAFAHDAARLSFLYWTEQGANAISASDETNSMLSLLLQKIKPTTPEVARLYFGILMSICAHRSDSHIFGQTAFSFVQLFLEDLVTHLEADDFHILQDNIVFLLSFVNDPLDQNGAEMLCSQIDVIFWKDLYSLTPFDDGNEAKKASISDFMMKIEAINARIRCNYSKFPDSSLYNFPKVIPPQFLDFLLKKFKCLKDRMNSDRKYVPFVKYKIIKIEEQLASLCPVFVPIFDFQNETWLQVVNVLYLTEYVIMSSISSLFVFDHPFWYHMAYLSKVFDELQEVKAKLETIKLENNAIGFVSEVAETVEDEFGTVVGFEDEKEKIIGMLTRESKALEIVSIVGMGGSGKTTLAQHIFKSLSRKNHFDVVAFYTVSAIHNTRKLLLDIISAIKGVDDKRRDMTNDDLAHELLKCLSHRRYLVVLDDIWDVSAWEKVKRSFPDHDKGSRIMFTSRSREVGEKCGIDCSTHQLRLMTEIESLELFQNKVFRNDISPPDLQEIGKRIAKNCKGLPLAVVVIGGLLARTEKSLKWWSEVEQGLTCYLSKVVGSLELSYKHLPENLKPCFIYLAAFPEDTLISVKRVIWLWIAEGFVQEENVATQYIHDLIDRSLIIVAERSSSGGIKGFRVHDLVRELCVMKCRDGNFFELNHGIVSSSTSSHSIKNTYRLSMQTEDDTIAAGSSLCNARTLCYFYSENSDGKLSRSHLRKFRLLQVLDWKRNWGDDIFNQLNSLIHLRHIHACTDMDHRISIPLSLSNLWNITFLEFELQGSSGAILLPETFWRMKSLRHVKLSLCYLVFPNEEEDEAYLSSDQILDKVVSFSTPVLRTQKDIKRLHQRLPALQKLSCYIAEETPFDFHWELESLKLCTLLSGPLTTDAIKKFPSTLKKLTLDNFLLQNGTCLSAIAEKLHVLEVLKLNYVHLSESIKLEMEDLVFQKLKFFQLVMDNRYSLVMDNRYSLEEWSASTESFPCLEQLVIHCDEDLKELPPCFGEMSTLKRVVAVGTLSLEAQSSVFRIKEELKELGTQLELEIIDICRQRAINSHIIGQLAANYDLQRLKNMFHSLSS